MSYVIYNKNIIIKVITIITTISDFNTHYNYWVYLLLESLIIVITKINISYNY